jgi:hypothetical protein
MKTKLILTVLILISAAACELFDKEDFPEPPDSYTVLAETVSLEFRINRLDGVSVELSLNGAQESENLYFLFELSDDWKKGHFGLVLKDISGSGILNEDSGIKPDISRFQKDNKGNPVVTYTFDNTLVEDDEGSKYIRLSYTGPAMPLIESLQVAKNMSMPQHISDKFGIKEDIEFQEGKYGLDKDINGFWVPVLLK